MENTLFKGDYIFVNKVSYGAIIPNRIQEIPLINIIYFFFDNKIYDYRSLDKNVRFYGLREIKKNDIIIFHNVDDQTKYLVKRCTGVKGDYLTINYPKFLINNQELIKTEKTKFLVKISFRNKLKFNSFFKSINISFEEDWSKKNKLEKFLVVTYKEYKILLSKTHEIRKITLLENSLNNKSIFNEEYIRNKTIRIPYKGFKISINNNTPKIYKFLIEKYEKVNIKQKNENSNPILDYTFRHNYYFMTGDNTNSSLDSRIWGFVPDYFIVGNTNLTVYSKVSNKIFSLIN